MKKFSIALAVALLCTTPALAEVQLLVDDNIKVTAINGEAITQSPFRPLQKEFKLGAGTAVITAKYERLFDLNRKDHDVVRSKDITISATLADGTYRLTMPNVPSHYNDVKEYVKTPKLAILNGTTVVSEQAASHTSSTGLLSGIGAMFGRGNSVTDNQKVIAAINQTPAQPSSQTQSRPNATVLDKFMELWLSANEEERQKIRQWVEK